MTAILGEFFLVKYRTLTTANPCRIRSHKSYAPGEVKSFLKVAESSRYYIAFLSALITGMRQGETLVLRWKDIDFNNNTLSIKQTLNRAGNKIIAGAKTKSG